MTLVRRSLALALVAALSVGCSGGDPEPKLTPSTDSVASTPSGSAEDQPSATTSTLSAREQQRAFIDDYFAAVSEAMVTGDSSSFMRLSSPDCENCKVFARNLADAYAGGGGIDGAHWQVGRADHVGRNDLGSVWNVDVATSAERWLDGSGQVVEEIPAGTRKFGVALVRTMGQGWLVRELRGRR